MTKTIKKANRERQLEREKFQLEFEAECAETVRKALTRKLSRLTMQNRAMKKGWRGPWRRLKAWWRTRRKT